MFYADSNVIESLKQQITTNLETLLSQVEVPEEFEFQGLGMFRNSVVWAAPVKETEFLFRLYDFLELILLKNNCVSILPSFIPHVTLLNSNEIDMKISLKDLGNH